MGEAADPGASYPGEFVVQSRFVGAWAMLTLAGELDLATVPAAECELAQAERQTRLVLLDLSGVSLMDSTGLHMVIKAARRLADRNGRLVLVDVPRSVRRLFEVTRTIDHLDIVRDALGFLATDLAGRASGARVRPDSPKKQLHHLP
ncbi:MAG TPA: STAS domain-containing protein [Solirubrobacteraceae bacterium]|jgi:anti-sigma B factor antagonist